MDNKGLEFPIYLYLQRFADHIGGTEIFCSHIFGYHHRMRVRQRLFWIPAYQREGKDGEEIPIRKHDLLVKRLTAQPYHLFPLAYPHKIPDLGNILLKGGALYRPGLTGLE